LKFLVDRCAGRRLADWLRDQGHDVREATEIVPDPGDQALLRWAVREQRILVTIDNDFGLLVFHHNEPHTGILRLPDLPAAQRIALTAQIIERYTDVLADGAILTVGSDRVRISAPHGRGPTDIG
jgi:predicted nuclease of predicted toxin-antitoxin system